MKNLVLFIGFIITIPADFDFLTFIESAKSAGIHLSWDRINPQNGSLHQEAEGMAVELFDADSSHKSGGKAVLQSKLTTTCGLNGLPTFADPERVCTLGDYQPILQAIADKTPLLTP